MCCCSGLTLLIVMEEIYSRLLTNVSVCAVLIFFFSVRSHAQFVNVTSEQISTSVVNENTLYGNGVSFYDFNKDGWDDLTIADGAQNIHFFVNNAGNFTEISLDISNPEGYQVIMVLWADYDNDDDEDLLVTRSYGPVQLWQNQGDLTFTNVAVEAGLDQQYHFYWGAAYADYDHDGFLDLLIAKYYHPTYNPGYEFRSILYHNNGDGTFSDVNLSSGFDLPPRPCFQPVFLDYNHDGWEDFFLVIDRIAFSNELYMNNGNGTFTSVTASSGVGQSICSMTCTADDFDNDQDEDIYVTNGPNGNLLLVNQDGNSFVNQAAEMGVVLNQVTWGSLWIDYDNNTWLDLFVSVTSPVLAPIGNQFFINNEGTSFTNGTELAGLANDDTQTHMVATGDFNNDGYPDIITNNRFPYESNLWQNTGAGNHYIGIDLEGVLANKNGIGSSIHCYAGGQHYYRQTKCGENFTAQNSGKEIFGLGTTDEVDSLVIYWNSGTVDKYYELAADQYYNFIEGDSFAASFQIASSGAGFCPDSALTLDAGDYLTFLWNTGDTTRFIVVAEPGYYYVNVSDIFGNLITSDSIFITEYGLPQPEIVYNNPTCYGTADGSIVVTDTANEINVSWSDGFSGSTRDQLLPGVYSGSVVNSFGCQNEFTVTLTTPDSLELYADIMHPTCFELSNGSIQPHASGGTPPYVFEPEMDSLINLGSGIHTLSVIDSLGCTASSYIELIQPPLIQVDLQIEHVLCFGENNGQVNIIAEGGTPPYTSDFPFDLQNLAAGTYQVAIYDSLGCTSDTSFTVLQPELLFCNVTATPQYQNGELGSASLETGGGISPYTILWSEGTEDALVLNNLNAGDYQVIVTDAAGCICESDFVVDLLDAVETMRLNPFTVYPQPAINVLYIACDNGQNFDIRIFDVTGKVKYEVKNNTEIIHLDVQNWTSGLYYISLIQNDRTSTIPCVIAR